MPESATTVGLVLREFIIAITSDYPELKTVYDSQLRYDTAIEKLRSANLLNSTNNPPYPLFVFKRSPLRYQDDHLKRTSCQSVVSTSETLGVVNPSVDVYRMLYASLDLDFMWIHNNMQELEEFEIYYLSENGISSHKQLIVDVPSVGRWRFFVKYKELKTISTETDKVYNKILSGSLTISGWFVVFKSTSSIIKEINTSIKTFYNSILADFQILG